MSRKLFSSAVFSAVDKNLNEIRKEVRLWFKHQSAFIDVKFSGNDAFVTLENRDSTLWDDQIKSITKGFKNAIVKYYPGVTCDMRTAVNESGDFLITYHFEFGKKNVKSSFTKTPVNSAADWSDYKQAAHNVRSLPEFKEAYNQGKIANKNDLQNFLYELDKIYDGTVLAKDPASTKGYDYNQVMGLVEAIMEEDVEVRGKAESPYANQLSNSITSDANEQSEKIAKMLKTLNEANLPDDKKQELLEQLSELTDESSISSSKEENLCNSLLKKLDKLEQIVNSKNLADKESVLKLVRNAYNYVLDTREMLA